MARKKPTSSTSQPSKKPKDAVFMIMPFGNFFDVYYEDIYSKAITKANLLPTRLDDSTLPVALVQEMVDMTRQSKIVLVDLTGNNPNVCYELGLAHALDKPAVIISDSIENLPFDVSAFRVVLYDKNLPDWGEQLKQKITAALIKITEDPAKSLPSRLLTAAEKSTDDVDNNVQFLIRDLERQREMLQHSIRNSRVHSGNALSHTRARTTIGPDEAKNLIENYKKRGFSKDFITTRLVGLGVPKSWIENQLR